MKAHNILQFILCCCLLLLQISLAFSQANAPFAVRLFKNGRRICAGTLVSPNFVVTAARCIQNIQRPQNLTVEGSGGIRSNVSKTMRPGNFNDSLKDKDVAVLKLQTPLNGTSIQPATLCSQGWKHGDNIKVYDFIQRTNGFGFRNLKVFGRFKCAKEAKLFGRSLTDTMFCAAPAHDACRSVKGGPVIINGQFCGIVSWSFGCMTASPTLVFTNVLQVQDFIRKNMLK